MISLRRKILFGMIFLLVLFGVTTALVSRAMLLGMLKGELLQKGLIHAKSISASSLVDVLTHNSLRLEKLLDDEKKMDKDTAYIFIIDPVGRLLAHTFLEGFPVELKNANAIPENRDFNIQALDTQLGLIYDFTVPIFSEGNQIGQVRLGIFRSSITRTIALISRVIAAVTLLIILVGVFLAYKISALITRPIFRLVEATRSIQKGDFSAKVEVKSQDEIGLLAKAFNQMVSHLNELVLEVERLTKNKEREQIALDLHDNCAQDLANIAKRLELCKKLFRLEPAKAFAELNSLRENILAHLSKARHLINGLKSSPENDFVLLQEIGKYIKDFQHNNDIQVGLFFSEAINDIKIPLDKAKQIFYIITEALTNIRKHSQAKNVELCLVTQDQNVLAINIKDDGQGFQINEAQASASREGKWGLMSMRQRANSLGGSLVISSVPNQGTEISVRIP
ncbi:MAG: HAMP domain-containing protein [Candidatus Omnitrophota bacterium]